MKVARNLRIVHKAHGREIISEITGTSIARRLSKLKNISEVSMGLQASRQLYLANVTLAGVIDSEMERSGFYRGLLSLLQDASLAQMAYCLGGVSSLSYRRARKLLDTISTDTVHNAVMMSRLEQIGPALQLLFRVHPRYMATLVQEWRPGREAEQVVESLVQQVKTSKFGIVKLCSVVAGIARADGWTGQHLALSIDNDRLISAWQAANGRLDMLGKVVGALTIANHTRAADFVQSIGVDNIQLSFARSSGYPKAVGFALTRLYRVHRKAARVGYDELTEETNRVQDMIKVLLSRLDLQGLAIFLRGMVLILEERSMDQDRVPLVPALLYDDFSEDLGKAILEALRARQLDAVKSFFSIMAEQASLKQYFSSCLGEIIPGLLLVIDDKLSLEECSQLIEGVRKIDQTMGRQLIHAKREVILRRFRNRMRYRRGDLSEIGDFLIATSRMEPRFSVAAIQEIDWAMVQEEVRAEANLGRISRFVQGLAAAGFNPSSDSYASFRVVVDVLKSDITDEPSLSKISELVFSLTTIDREAVGTFLSENRVRNHILASLEVEARINVIHETIGALIRAENWDGRMLISHLSLDALAGKIAQEGQLLHIVQLIHRMYLAVPVLDDESGEIPVRVLLKHKMHYWRLIDQIEREADAGVVATMFWYIMKHAPSRATSLFSRLEHRVVARRIAGVKQSDKSPNVTDVDRREMLSRLVFHNGIAKVSALLSTARQIDRSWAVEFLNEFRQLYLSLESDAESTSSNLSVELYVDVVKFGEPDQAAWFAFEVTQLDPEAGEILGSQWIEEWMGADSDRIRRNLVRVAWALWILSQVPAFTLRIKALAHRIVNAVGRAELDALVTSARNVHDSALLVGGFGIVQDLFSEACWDSLYRTKWAGTGPGADRRLLAMAVTSASGTRAMEWNIEVSPRLDDRTLWAYGRRVYRVGAFGNKR